METMGIELIKEIFQNKKVLITGDTGFKGSWLALCLLNFGARVYGYALPPKTENDNYVITGLADHFEHKDGDIRNKEELFNYFQKVKPDFAFHLAAQPLVIPSYEEPDYTFHVNILGTVNFFEAIRNTKSVKVALNITSDKCYENKEWVWGYRENDSMGGKDPYSASKGCSELITNSYQHSFFEKANTCNIASVRAGNVIGAGDWADYRIVPDYFRALINNTILEIRNPESTRPWQHVLEPLNGYLYLAAMLFKEGNKYSGGWNFGPLDSLNYSVSELIQEINKFEKKCKYKIYKTTPQKESHLLKLDTSKAQRLLNWKPVLSFNEAVDITVKGYLNDIQNKNAFENRIETINGYFEKYKNRQRS